jgi:hypothetical protein
MPIDSPLLYAVMTGACNVKVQSAPVNNIDEAYRVELQPLYLPTISVQRPIRAAIPRNQRPRAELATVPAGINPSPKNLV